MILTNNRRAVRPLVVLPPSENLQAMPSFNGLNIPRSKEGKIDPVTDLFRTDWPGVTTGPVVSQFMLSNFFIDSINVEPKADPLTPGVDYMTAFQPWLDVQVGIISYTWMYAWSAGMPNKTRPIKSPAIFNDINVIHWNCFVLVYANAISLCIPTQFLFP